MDHKQLVDGRAEIRFVDEAPSAPIPDAGIDPVNFGPGQSDQAHQPDEHASIAHRHEAKACCAGSCRADA